MRLLPVIDPFSFWFGAIIASVVCWVIILLNPMLKHVREEVQEKIIHKREQSLNTNKTEESYRQNIYRYAQSLHLASSLFSLDEIILPPTLLAPPPRVDPETSLISDEITAATIAYLPAWPELSGEMFTKQLPQAQ